VADWVCAVCGAKNAATSTHIRLHREIRSDARTLPRRKLGRVLPREEV
jgi:hypothetical protein